MVLLAAFQLSGTVHTLVDTVKLALDAGAHQQDCDDDGDCKNCPPGCSACHCAPGGFFAPRSFDPKVLTEEPGGGELLTSLSDDRTHDDPSLRSVYRPPEPSAG